MKTRFEAARTLLALMGAAMFLAGSCSSPRGGTNTNWEECDRDADCDARGPSLVCRAGRCVAEATDAAATDASADGSTGGAPADGSTDGSADGARADGAPVSPPREYATLCVPPVPQDCTLTRIPDVPGAVPGRAGVVAGGGFFVEVYGYQGATDEYGHLVGQALALPPGGGCSLPLAHGLRPSTSSGGGVFLCGEEARGGTTAAATCYQTCTKGGCSYWPPDGDVVLRGEPQPPPAKSGCTGIPQLGGGWRSGPRRFALSARGDLYRAEWQGCPAEAGVLDSQEHAWSPAGGGPPIQEALPDARVIAAASVEIAGRPHVVLALRPAEPIGWVSPGFPSWPDLAATWLELRDERLAVVARRELPEGVTVTALAAEGAYVAAQGVEASDGGELPWLALLDASQLETMWVRREAVGTLSRAMATDGTVVVADLQDRSAPTVRRLLPDGTAAEVTLPTTPAGASWGEWSFGLSPDGRMLIATEDMPWFAICPTDTP
ncbi:MAG: hypothetical protein FJ104_07700 [Deltaproteobacteria bacterium]|nr:hypothetical protein [Deltaproteobacteria bacterium]